MFSVAGNGSDPRPHPCTHHDTSATDARTRRAPPHFWSTWLPLTPLAKNDTCILGQLSRERPPHLIDIDNMDGTGWPPYWDFSLALSQPAASPCKPLTRPRPQRPSSSPPGLVLLPQKHETLDSEPLGSMATPISADTVRRVRLTARRHCELSHPVLLHPLLPNSVRGETEGLPLSVAKLGEALDESTVTDMSAASLLSQAEATAAAAVAVPAP